MPSIEDIQNAYTAVKKTCKRGWSTQKAGDAILNLAILSLRFLNTESNFIKLKSKVKGKQYVSYRRNRIVARPANSRLFIRDAEKVVSLWRAWEAKKEDHEGLSEMSYTIALAPCLAMELFDRQNKKGPATYFECLIGHIFSRTLGQDPTKSVSLPIHGRSIRMTMDFLFDLGKGKASIHLPVKMSTRERVVQAWAHQRLLDAAYGRGKYKGIMVLFSETKMDSRSLEVIEICVPEQWLVYQTLLAKLDKIFYFDVPERYQTLTKKYPQVIQILQFGEFFNQINQIVK